MPTPTNAARPPRELEPLSEAEAVMLARQNYTAEDPKAHAIVRTWRLQCYLRTCGVRLMFVDGKWGPETDRAIVDSGIVLYPEEERIRDEARAAAHNRGEWWKPGGGHP